MTTEQTCRIGESRAALAAGQYILRDLSGEKKKRPVGMRRQPDESSDSRRDHNMDLLLKAFRDYLEEKSKAQAEEQEERD